jgi:hypothetical protein
LEKLFQDVTADSRAPILDGFANLLFEMMKGIKMRFYSKTSQITSIILHILLSVSQSDVKYFAIVSRTFMLLCHHAEESSQDCKDSIWTPLLKTLHTHLEVCLSKPSPSDPRGLGMVLHILCSWISYKHGTVLCGNFFLTFSHKNTDEKDLKILLEKLVNVKVWQLDPLNESHTFIVRNFIGLSSVFLDIAVNHNDHSKWLEGCSKLTERIFKECSSTPHILHLAKEVVTTFHQLNGALDNSLLQFFSLFFAQLRAFVNNAFQSSPLQVMVFLREAFMEPSIFLNVEALQQYFTQCFKHWDIASNQFQSNSSSSLYSLPNLLLLLDLLPCLQMEDIDTWNSLQHELLSLVKKMEKFLKDKNKTSKKNFFLVVYNCRIFNYGTNFAMYEFTARESCHGDKSCCRFWVFQSCTKILKKSRRVFAKNRTRTMANSPSSYFLPWNSSTIVPFIRKTEPFPRDKIFHM